MHTFIKSWKIIKLLLKNSSMYNDITRIDHYPSIILVIFIYFISFIELIRWAHNCLQ